MKMVMRLAATTSSSTRWATVTVESGSGVRSSSSIEPAVPIETTKVSSCAHTNTRKCCMKLDLLRWGSESPLGGAAPGSFCSYPCGPGERQTPMQGASCCWMCEPCRGYDFLLDEMTCRRCPFDSRPDANRSSCVPIPIVRLELHSPWAAIPLAVATAGLAAAAMVTAVFVRNWSTPLVRASGRELSAVLLLGIMLSYCATFAMVSLPGPVACAARRLAPGFGPCVTYAALLAKTSRIQRIFAHGRRSAVPPRCISPASQLGAVAVLVGLQLIAMTAWLFVEPPRAARDYGELPLLEPDRARAFLRCAGSELATLASLAYSLLLMVVCTIYAVKTRAVPESFNEAKPIGLTMYTTCIVWLAFVPIFFGTARSGDKIYIQTATLTMSMSLSATVAICLLFLPKVYIIVFHPEQNVIKHKRSLKGSQASPAPSDAAANGPTDKTGLAGR
uniref:G-protein coupled receptors family 3 profile domain-containing protein n=1 Tax=Eptatretus burgeri TaxID=7764 RepID=A0A8C4R2M0_EPTBU